MSAEKAIARHRFDTARVEEEFRLAVEHFPANIDSIRANPGAADLLMHDALRLAGFASGVDPASPEIARALRVAAHAGTAVFRLAQKEGKTTEISLGEGPPVRCKAEIDESLVGVGLWLDTFYVNAICRDSKLQDSLCETTTDDLRKSSTRGARYLYLFVDALRSLWYKEASAAKHVLKALKAIPARFDPLKPTYNIYIGAPIMALAGDLANKGLLDMFNGTLERALRLHKKFWAQGKDARADPRGLLSIDLLAMVSLAHDRGVRIAVNSDYIPAHLVRGEPFEKGRK
jgi:hypothetical protein